MKLLIDLAEKGLVPNFFISRGIRSLLLRRLHSQSAENSEKRMDRFERFIEELRKSPIAIQTHAANQQHYEVPAPFFLRCLGKRLKYSSCYFPDAQTTLDAAEGAMLRLYAERAELKDGMDILELGCGWGSFTLWLGEQFPNARIRAVSNSKSQKEFIDGEARARGLSNIEIITADMNVFDVNMKFDRVVSIEMFEHMRNYEKLMEKIASWLKPAGKLFVHIFCHKEFAYPFETEGDENWMGRYFFTGGIMPSENLLLHFQRDLLIERQWRVNGTHYERTSRLWLENVEKARAEVIATLGAVYGKAEALLWFHRWRMFFLACAELFGFRGGEEWFVAHYLFSKRGDRN